MVKAGFTQPCISNSRTTSRSREPSSELLSTAGGEPGSAV